MKFSKEKVGIERFISRCINFYGKIDNVIFKEGLK